MTAPTMLHGTHGLDTMCEAEPVLAERAFGKMRAGLRDIRPCVSGLQWNIDSPLNDPPEGWRGGFGPEAPPHPPPSLN